MLPPAFALYDFILIFNDEWSLVWRRKWTSTTVLIVVNRATIVLYLLANALPTKPQVCVISVRLRAEH